MPINRKWGVGELNELLGFASLLNDESSDLNGFLADLRDGARLMDAFERLARDQPNHALVGRFAGIDREWFGWEVGATSPVSTIWFIDTTTNVDDAHAMLIEACRDLASRRVERNQPVQIFARCGHEGFNVALTDEEGVRTCWIYAPEQGSYGQYVRDPEISETESDANRKAFSDLCTEVRSRPDPVPTAEERARALRLAERIRGERDNGRILGVGRLYLDTPFALRRGPGPPPAVSARFETREIEDGVSVVDASSRLPAPGSFPGRPLPTGFEDGVLPSGTTLSDPWLEMLMSDVQSNVIKPHGRPRVLLVGLQAEDPADRRSLLQLALDGQEVTSQWRDLEAVSPRSGRRYLGAAIGAAALESFDEAPQIAPLDPSGFKPGPDATELQIDVLLQIGVEDDQDAETQLRLVEDRTQSVGRRVFALIGLISPDGSTPPPGQHAIGWFGHEDGISRPRFLSDDLQKSGGGGRVWSSAASLSSVLCPPVGSSPTGGSVLSMMQLEQNVEAYQQCVADMAQSLASNPGVPASADLEARCSGLLIGRWPDGWPIHLDRGGDRRMITDFELDPPRGTTGGRCPARAHIRIMEDRTTARAPLARRGLFYGGEHVPTTGPLAADGRGLIFLAYTSTPERIQGMLADIGRDPILSPDREPQSAPSKWEDPISGSVVDGWTGDFVTYRGGGNFWVPPLSWLERTIGTQTGASAT